MHLATDRKTNVWGLQLDPKYAHSFSLVVFFHLLSTVNHFKKPKVKPVIDLASFFVGEFCLWSTLERH